MSSIGTINKSSFGLGTTVFSAIMNHTDISYRDNILTMNNFDLCYDTFAMILVNSLLSNSLIEDTSLSFILISNKASIRHFPEYHSQGGGDVSPCP